MQKRGLILFSLIMLFSITMINAGGLIIVGDNIFNINKTVNNDVEITFQLKNEEVYDMVNISFVDNNIISMDRLGVLEAGTTTTITAKVYSNDDVNSEIQIEGFYNAVTGQQNKTYYVTIDFEDDLSICDMTIIKGDSINWRNLVNDEVKLRNMETSEYITTMSYQTNYSTTFEEPDIFDYAVYRRGFKFTDTCRIVTLDDTGLINNPDYNAKIQLNVNTDYEPTELSTNLLNDNFVLDFFSSTEGIIMIENIGSYPAKKVYLSSPWMQFSNNNFDLNIGESKAIIFTIYPDITHSNQTNKTYNHEIKLEGNFPTITDNVSIFINQATIEGDLDYSNSTKIIDFICELRPDWCNPQENIVYKYVDSDDGTFNITLAEEQFNEWLEFGFEREDAYTLFEAYIREELNNQTSTMKNIQANMTELLGVYYSLQIEEDETSGSVVFVIVFLSFMGAIGLLVWIFLLVRKNRKLNLVKTF